MANNPRDDHAHHDTAWDIQPTDQPPASASAASDAAPQRERKRRSAAIPTLTTARPHAKNGKTTIPNDALAYEEAMTRLDETVNALESGHLPLEDALRLYEQGVQLAQRCQELLDNAELRLQRLRSVTDPDTNAGAMFALESFDLDERD